LVNFWMKIDGERESNLEWRLWKLAVQVLDRHSIPIESDLGPSGLSLSNPNSTNLVLSATTAKEKATSKTTAGTFTQKRRQNSDTLSMQDSQKPLSHWHQLESHPENEIYFKIRVYTIVCCLSVVCCLVSIVRFVCSCLYVSCITVAGLTVGSRSPGEVLSVFQCHLLSCLSSRLLCHLLCHLLISRQERLVYLG
jgi:hypothetical protein